MKDFDRFRDAHIEEVAGIPAFVIDGEVVGPMGYQFSAQYKGIEEKLKSLGESGVRLYYIREELGDPELFPELLRKLREDTALLREKVPEARAMVWLQIFPYAKFAEKYPEDVIRFHDGTTGTWTNYGRVRLPSPDTPRFSFASEAYKSEIAGVLRRLVRAVGASELRDTIVGYFFFTHAAECCWFWDYDQENVSIDYSPAMRRAFRDFLIEKYAGSEKELQKAWNDDTVTFRTAEVPSNERRHRTDYGYFWDPAVSGQVRDYAQCHSDVLADQLLNMARIVKEETGNRALTGTFYGYLQNQDLLWGGHSRFKRVMDSPYLDFWAAPFTYENRELGNTVCMRMVVKSLQQHGKVWLCEADTFVSDSGGPEFHGFPEITPEASPEIVKRDFAFMLCEGTQGWWIDWSSGESQYREDGLKGLMTRCQEIAKESFRMDLRGVSDVAAVIDQESLIATKSEMKLAGLECFESTDYAVTEEEIRRKFPTDLINNAIDRNRIHELCRIGTHVDYYETDDLFTKDFRKHKLYIFLNAYETDGEERRQIAEKLKRDGNVLVFLYGAGLIDPEGPVTIGPENASDLVGMKLGVKTEERRSRMVTLPGAERALPGLIPGDEIGDFERPITCGFEFKDNFGHPFRAPANRIDPVLCVEDGDAIPLAVYKEGGEVGFAMKEFADWTSVYVGSPAIQSYVLRALAKKAGAHLYVDEDAVVYANRSYVAIHTDSDGERTVRLPGIYDVSETFDRRPTAEGVSEFTEYIPRGTTRLYCLRPADGSKKADMEAEYE